MACVERGVDSLAFLLLWGFSDVGGRDGSSGFCFRVDFKREGRVVVLRGLMRLMLRLREVRYLYLGIQLVRRSNVSGTVVGCLWYFGLVG